MKKNIILLIFSCLLMPNAWAAVGDTFTFTYEGNTLQYEVIDTENNYVSVSASFIAITPTLIIPDNVVNDDITYTVTAIAEDAFYKCDQITSLTLPNSLQTIGSGAFTRCKSITNIIIPANVSVIDGYAFLGCTRLTTMEFTSESIMPKNIDKITDEINNITFIVPNGLINNYVQYWHNSELNIYEKSENVFSIDGLIYTIHSNEVSIRYGYSASSDLKIGDYVTHKNGYQYNITSVDSAAFYKTTYSSITLGNNVKTIGLQAFAMMENMEGKTITFPESIEFIDNNAFIKCASEYKFLSNTPPELGDYVYGIFSPKRASTPAEKEQQKINDGSTLFTIPCGANKNNAWSSGNWGYPFFTDFLEQDCQNLYITKQNENLTNLPNESNEDFGKIRYTRYFKAGVWETLYLPFEIESMQIDGADYKDYIWRSKADDNTAVFYLAKLVNGTTDFTIATSIEKGVPYVILFGEESHSEYYANHPVTFISKENYNYIPNDWNQSTTSLTMYGNTTLQPKTITNAYYLGNNNSFELTDTYTLNPFECYISPEKVNGVQNMQARRFSVRVRPQSDVTTGVPTVDSDQLFCQIVGNTLTIQTNGQPVNIYNINGMLIHSFAEGNEQVSIDLDNGCYIINSLGYTQKIIF
ncbi:MAG: leucine-rich repeat domain-containing protein [Paludibacteraceae bacterium]|nr:leucine-rich repeat domain-containing protein [Paludibacteraceae bacterium]